MTRKLFVLAFISIVLFLLGSCKGNETEQSDPIIENNSHGHMESDTTEVPDGLEPSADPLYKAGSQVIIKADHHEGMDGAKATVLNAFDTIAYIVTYTPTTGGDPVTDHKWIIQEEIEGAGNEMLSPGTEVTIEADHMEGMEGAKGIINKAENTTVYIVDYEPTTGAAPVTNHKWLTEEEIFPE